MQRVVGDLFRTIEDFDVTPVEFWAAMSYLTEVGQTQRGRPAGPGLGIEHFFDLRIDEGEKQAGLEGGTPRTIEGPLYLADAPMSKGEARLDDGSEQGEVLFMEGQVRDTDGKPMPGPSSMCGTPTRWAATRSSIQRSSPGTCAAASRPTPRAATASAPSCRPAMAARRTGRRSKLLGQLGRHGHRPAHMHFFVSAPGYRKLTTQINIAGDDYLHDDFAFATRDELIPGVTRHADPDRSRSTG